MNVTPEFEKWAKGFSGCDGGNLKGSIWLCGIEWGLGEDHVLEQEIRKPVSKPPQKYKSPEDNLKYQYNVKAIKLFAAMRGHDVRDYESVAFETPFPFHQESKYFKLNLFPIAFKELKQKKKPQLWNDKYGKLTGLSTADEYLDWCRENRFPQMCRWAETGKPKLIIGTGRWAKDDFPKALGFNGAQVEEEIGGLKLVSMIEGGTTLAMVPFLGYQNGLLNSHDLLQKFGERLGELVERRA